MSISNNSDHPLPIVKEPSPIEFLAKVDRDINVYVKREDLLHPEFGGNKWRKLKYNLIAYREKNYQHLITFGGPFSNHIHATAAACKAFDIPSVGIIRGEYSDPNNPTLKYARDSGMQLFFVPKVEYSLKEDSPYVSEIISTFQKPLVLPEGGSNDAASLGVMEIIKEIDESQMEFDAIVLAAGTGRTAIGVINASQSRRKVYVVNALKNLGLKDAIKLELSQKFSNWEVLNDYHFGGFAKVPEELQSYYSNFYKKYKLQLDPIYNAKAMYALFELIENKSIPDHSNVLFLNTGGQQGIEAFEYVKGISWNAHS